MPDYRRRKEDRWLASGAPAPRWTGSWFPTLVVGVFVLFTYSTYNEHLRYRRGWEDRLEQQGRDAGLALTGIVNAQMSMGAFLAQERLRDTIEAVVGANRWVRDMDLYGPKGDLLASTSPKGPAVKPDGSPPEGGGRRLVQSFAFPGVIPGLRTAPPGPHELVRPFVLPSARIPEIVAELLPSLQISESSPFGLGLRLPRVPTEENAGLWAALAASPDHKRQLAPYALTRAVIGIDSTGVEAALERGLERSLGALLLAALAAGALLLSWRNLQRSANLTVHLVFERERNRHLEEMRLAAAGLAHETRNPLNVVRNVAQSLAPSISDEKARERVMTVVEEVDRISARLSEFIAYSKPRNAAPRPIDIDGAVAQVVRLMRGEAEDRKVTLSVEGNCGRALADEDLLRQALFNLTNNAVAAVAEGGRVTLRLGREDRAWIEVVDDGPGVPEEHRENIFKPYFTLKSKGTGLGLAVVQQIATAHGWTVRYVHREGCGAVFRLDGLQPA